MACEPRNVRVISNKKPANPGDTNRLALIVQNTLGGNRLAACWSLAASVRYGRKDMGHRSASCGAV